MRVLIFLPLAAAFQVLDQTAQLGTHSDFQGLKDSLKSISASTGGKINQTTIEAVQAILNEVNGTLMSALEADRNHTQHILNMARSEVEQCDVVRSNWFGDGMEWSRRNTNVSSEGTEHDNCRGEEANLFDAMTTACDTIDRQVANWEICPLPPGLFAAGDNDKIDEYICCLQRFFTTNRPTYATRRQACINATNVHAAKRADCHTEQDQFERAFCSREVSVQNECRSYRECRTREETHWWIVYNDTKEVEEIFQAQRVALECLLCYGKKILSNQTDLSECETPISCQSLDWCPTIDYEPALDEFTNCTEPVGDASIPCNTQFIADWYQQYSNDPTEDFRACSEHENLPDRAAAVPPPWPVPSTNSVTVAPSPVTTCTPCSHMADNLEESLRPNPTGVPGR